MSDEERTIRTPQWVIWAVFGVSFSAWVAWGFWLGPWLAFAYMGNAKTETFGQFGDLFGGINALFTALAFAAVWWTGRMQREELELQRGELRDTREVFLRQAFEATFFRQLELLRALALSFSVSESRGFAAWDEHANSCRRLLKGSSVPPANIATKESYLEYLRREYSGSIYKRRESYLGPYFRVLYHIFKLVDTQEYLTDDQKVGYASLARAQLGGSELIALAVNYVSEYSDEFKPLIEKYGILKHLPKEEWRSKYDACVAPTTFMGFEQRKAYWESQTQI